MLLKVERLEKFSNFRDFVVLEIASMCASKKDFNENCMIYSYSNWPYQKKKIIIIFRQQMTILFLNLNFDDYEFRKVNITRISAQFTTKFNNKKNNLDLIKK